MNKIVDYIVSGKGIGTLFIFLFALTVALVSSFNLKQALIPVIPHVQQAADELLPIKIENHQVVSPQNIIKTYRIENENQPFVLVLDTTRDMLDNTSTENGFYLTRSYFYSVVDGQVRRQTLGEQFDLKKQDYTPMMEKFVKWICVSVAFIGPFLNFIFFLIAIAFYALCSSLALKLNKKSADFPFKMRLNTVLFIGVYLFSTFLNYMNVPFSMLTFFLCMIALQVITLKYIGKVDEKN